MKLILFNLIFFLALPFSYLAYGQLPEKFNSHLAHDLIRLCNSYTFLDLYGSDADIIPHGYKKIYTSDIIGMDNKYQIYLNDSLAIINLRGSTSHTLSWLENIQSGMIPAKGTIETKNNIFDYCFAKDSNASVHIGYSLGLAYLSEDIVKQIKKLNNNGYYDIVITGHSQGGALSNLILAWLENIPDSTLSSRNSFRTYAFAAPMIGNKDFVKEYNQRYCKTHKSFNIVNPHDGVPKLPMSFNDTNLVFETIQQFETNPHSFDLTQFTEGLAYKTLGNLLILFLKTSGATLKLGVSIDLGHIKTPHFTNDVDYFYVDNRIELPPFEYPHVLKDSTTIKNDSLRAYFATDTSYFKQKSFVHEPMGFQHKPYNYYIAFIKTFFPNIYSIVDPKVLPENL